MEEAPTVTLNDATQQANQDITENYDKRVYTSNAFSFSSPGHVRAAAHLYGLDSIPLKMARVLELGCAGGGNLLPFAVSFPQAQVVGIDLSSVQVEQGQRVIKSLGINNLQLHTMSLTDITPEFGQFDYIIAHGVFSWVPHEVREAILRILRYNLSPNGIGYISYNTYPGWKAGDIVRDAMLMHSHDAGSDDDRLDSAKAVLNLLSDGIAASNPLAPSLRGAVAQLRTQSDYYVAHEYLETFNNPCYLLEFVSLADQHDLTHVGDAEPHLEMAATYGQNAQLNHSLIALGKPRELRQQYLDFAVGRNFRKSMVVHKERADQVLTSPDLERFPDLRWAGHFTKVEPAQNAPDGIVSFRNQKNQPLNTREAVVIALLETLTQAWPASLDFSTLLARVRPSLPQADDDATVRKTVLQALQTLFRLNSLRYTLETSPYDGADAETAASPSGTTGLAKHEAPALIPGAADIFRERQDPLFGISMYNLWHDSTNLQLKEAEAFLLPYIDGTHSRRQLATLLRDALSRGTVPATDGKFLKGQRNLDAVADKVVGKLLDLFKRQALLQPEQ